MDSDDYVSTNYIKYLYGLIEKTGADTSCCILKTVTSGDEKFVQVEIVFYFKDFNLNLINLFKNSLGRCFEIRS